MNDADKENIVRLAPSQFGPNTFIRLGVFQTESGWQAIKDLDVRTPIQAAEIAFEPLIQSPAKSKSLIRFLKRGSGTELPTAQFDVGVLIDALRTASGIHIFETLDPKHLMESLHIPDAGTSTAQNDVLIGQTRDTKSVYMRLYESSQYKMN